MKKAGFTFIEMAVVVAIIGLVIPVVFSIVYVIIREQVKIYRLSEVKRQGDFVLSTIENTIKNYALSTHNAVPPNDTNEICNANATSGGDPYFRDRYNLDSYFSYSLSSSKISSNSSVTGATALLTTDSVIIQLIGANPLVGCTRSSIYSTPVISINFSICYNVNGSCTSTRAEETAALNYSTKVKMKSY